jgi:transcriptional regulator with XRE-family HTH domain
MILKILLFIVYHTKNIISIVYSKYLSISIYCIYARWNSMSILSVEIGQRIRNYRLQQKLSQEELAEKCGLHPTYIGQVERGEKNATIGSISKIASGLNISLSMLFEHIEDYEKNKSNYPSIAYSLIQSVSEPNQEKIVEIIQTILELK